MVQKLLPINQVVTFIKGFAKTPIFQIKLFLVTCDNSVNAKRLTHIRKLLNECYKTIDCIISKEKMLSLAVKITLDKKV